MPEYEELFEFLKLAPPEIVIVIFDELPTQYLDLFRQYDIQSLLIDYMIEDRFLGYKKSPTMMTRRDFDRMDRPKYHTFEYQPAVRTIAPVYDDIVYPMIPVDAYGKIAIDVISQEYIDELHERRLQYAERNSKITRFDLTDNPRDQFYYNASKLPRHCYFDSHWEIEWGKRNDFKTVAKPHTTYEDMLEYYYTKDSDTHDYQHGVFASEVAAGMCKVLVEPEHNPITNAIDENAMAKNYTITTEVTKDGRAHQHTYDEFYLKSLLLSEKEKEDLKKNLNPGQYAHAKYEIETLGFRSPNIDGFVLNRPRNILNDLMRSSQENTEIIDYGDGTAGPVYDKPFTGHWWQNPYIREYSKEDLEEAEREYHRYFSENKEDLIKYIRV